MGCSASTANASESSPLNGGNNDDANDGDAPQPMQSMMQSASSEANKQAPPPDAVVDDIDNGETYDLCSDSEIGEKLHAAAEAGSLKTLSRILACQKGQDNINRELKTTWSNKFEAGFSCTPLMSAIAAGQLKAARLLASKLKGDVDYVAGEQNETSYSALAVSIICCKEEAMKMLVEDFKANLDVDSDNPPLIAATKCGNESAARYLIKHGAEVDRVLERYSLTALGFAALFGYQSMARLLMELGAEKEKALSKEELDPSTEPSSEREMARGFFLDLDRLTDLRKELEADRKALEQQVTAQLQSDIRPELLPTTAKGIRIKGLKKVAEKVKRLVAEGFFAQQKAYEDGTVCPAVIEYNGLTTTHVVYGWVKMQTDDKRLADYGGIIKQEDLGIPAYFISHAWKGGFARLVDEVLAYCERKGLSDETCVWIDVFAVNQHGGGPLSTEFSREQNRKDVAAFQTVLRTCLEGTIVVADFARCNTASRAWCLFEWDWTMYLHGREALQILGLTVDEVDSSQGIDIQQATCFKQSDYEMILAQVVEKHGSADAFNLKLEAKWMEVRTKLLGQ